MVNAAAVHPEFKTVTIDFGQHRDHIELRDGPDGQSMSIVISREDEEEYSSLIHRIPNEVPHKQEVIRRLSALEYTLANQLLQAQRERVFGTK